MQPASRKPNELAQQTMPLALLCMALVASNPSITIIDDESWILGAAAKSVRATLAMFWSGEGQHEHPPLYDIFLHFWLRLTGGVFEYLRIPSILFFLVGLFLLARVAKRLDGPAGAQAVVWLGALWPFAFFYGRLATWYSFSFFLVAWLTLAYLRYLEKQSFGNWALFSLVAAGLLWTNYFGWTILGCLAIDQFFRHRAGEPVARPAILARTTVLLCVVFLPLFRAFRSELGSGFNFHHRAITVLANAGFCFYSLFVSESVAPWHWLLSIPAGLAVLGCVGIMLVCVPSNVRRFLLYGFFLIALMAVSGILLTKRLLLISPWILLPLGIAIGRTKPLWARIALPLCLLVIGGIGWYGIHSKRYYSAPRFIEPWSRVADEASEKIRTGSTLIADNPSLLFYLTYILRPPDGAIPWKFAGVLPNEVRDPRVISPDEWLASGHPLSPKMLWIRGMNGPQTGGSMDDAAHELDSSCGARQERLMMRDDGYAWKQRFFPELGELQWRIEVREYDCASSNSREIFPIPQH